MVKLPVLGASPNICLRRSRSGVGPRAALRTRYQVYDLYHCKGDELDSAQGVRPAAKRLVSGVRSTLPLDPSDQLEHDASPIMRAARFPGSTETNSNTGIGRKVGPTGNGAPVGLGLGGLGGSKPGGRPRPPGSSYQTSPASSRGRRYQFHHGIIVDISEWFRKKVRE